MPQYSSNPYGAKIDTIEISDGAVTTDKLADGAVTAAKISAGASNAFASPIGSVLAWLKSYTNTPALPAGWVECNGQTLSDGDSVYDGQVIPNLNTGSYKTFRGAATSGGTGGSDSHTHNNYLSEGASGATGVASAASVRYTGSDGDNDAACATTDAASALPAYYEVVWILRVK